MTTCMEVVLDLKYTYAHLHDNAPLGVNNGPCNTLQIPARIFGVDQHRSINHIVAGPRFEDTPTPTPTSTPTPTPAAQGPHRHHVARP